MFQPHCAFTPPALPGREQPFRRLPTGLSRHKVEPQPPPDAPRAAFRRNAAVASATCSEKRDVFSEQFLPSAIPYNI